MTETLIRPSVDQDVGAVTRIYGHHVLNGLASFEVDPPDEAEMLRRRDDVVALSLPHLVAVRGSEVLGFAYAAPFRPRVAYRYTLEDSVYVDPNATGMGLGRALLTRVIEDSEELGYRQMVAVIGDSGNAASIGLHRSLGFEDAGILKATGLKFGRWVDTVLMQRPLGLGSSNIPGS